MFFFFVWIINGQPEALFSYEQFSWNVYRELQTVGIQTFQTRWYFDIVRLIASLIFIFSISIKYIYILFVFFLPWAISSRDKFPFRRKKSLLIFVSDYLGDGIRSQVLVVRDVYSYHYTRSIPTDIKCGSLRIETYTHWYNLDINQQKINSVLTQMLHCM